MLRELFEINFTDRENISFYFYWSKRPRSLIEELTNEKQFDEHRILVMIKGELLHHRRPDVIKRLVARYFKVKKTRQMVEIMEVLNGEREFDKLEEQVRSRHERAPGS